MILRASYDDIDMGELNWPKALLGKCFLFFMLNEHASLIVNMEGSGSYLLFGSLVCEDIWS